MNKQELIRHNRRKIAQLKKIGELSEHCKADLESAEIALASLEADPVFEVEVSGNHWLNAGPVDDSDFSAMPDGVNKLFTAPPVHDLSALVPDGITEQDAIDLIISGWNDDFLSGVKWHRAEMLRRIEERQSKDL